MSTATYNRADCKCGMDHDSLSHIVAMSILAMAEASAQGQHLSPISVGQAVERAARKVGWVKMFKEAEKSDDHA